MKAITFGQAYNPSVKTRFSHAALGFGSYSQEDCVQFGMSTPPGHLYGKPRMTKGQAIRLMLVSLAIVTGTGIWGECQRRKMGIPFDPPKPPTEIDTNNSQ